MAREEEFVTKWPMMSADIVRCVNLHNWTLPAESFWGLLDQQSLPCMRLQNATFSLRSFGLTSTMGNARELHGRILIPHRKKDCNIRSSIYGCLDTIAGAA
ncbi:hypothetical protein CEXT_422871 [Caerostris extrusa]|uniref:Uncharacterized protein n=1 Tax=Caerostris extrusa TaxID=172846 RepID=A0AAV4MMN5_CAEEX|nr:hypothetical protein CEXT_422871 [Caerostris extrusa]